MTIDRDALVERGLAAAIDKPSATTPGMVQFGSDMPDDVEDLRAVIAAAFDAILPEVQAQTLEDAAERVGKALVNATILRLLAAEYRKVASDE